VSITALQTPVTDRRIHLCGAVRFESTEPLKVRSQVTLIRIPHSVTARDLQTVAERTALRGLSSGALIDAGLSLRTASCLAKWLMEVSLEAGVAELRK
jgi:hypothetical protein